MSETTLSFKISFLKRTVRKNRFAEGTRCSLGALIV